MLRDNTTDFVPEPVLSIPHVILLHMRLVVRSYLLHAQELGFEKIQGFRRELMELREVSHPVNAVIHNLVPGVETRAHQMIRSLHRRQHNRKFESASMIEIRDLQFETLSRS